MSSRLLVALVIIGALLILAVGIGSAILRPSTPEKATPPQSEVLATATLAPSQFEGADEDAEEPADESELLPPWATSTPTAGGPPPTETSVPTNTSSGTPSHTPQPSATPKPERTGGPVTVPNSHKGVRWVTIQAGHYQNYGLPEELQHLVTHTGAVAGGVREVDINVEVARLAAQRLHERGYGVELLDATVPPNYTTDLFIALHADGSTDPTIRGFKAVAPWGSVPASDVFVGYLYEEYGKATGLPSDAKTSAAMANYYAFNPVKYRHAVNPAVPAALLEMGFVSNPQDRKVIALQSDKLAWGIANAVDRYFRSGVAGATPSPYPTFTPSSTPSPTTTSTSTPSSTASATPEVWDIHDDTAPLLELMLTKTVLVGQYTRTPAPTFTPLTGTITADGKWLPPVAPNGRRLPPLGSDSAPVFLGEADDDPGPGFEIARPDWQPHIWRQYYMPRLGRSIWVIGPAFERTPTRTPSPSATPRL